MADLNPASWWRRFLALPNESGVKILLVAFMVSAVCAVLVSTTSLLLSPIHEANRAAERQARLQEMLETMPGMSELLAGRGADGLETIVFDLESGEPTDLDPATLDRSPAAETVAIPADADIAGLGSRPRHVALSLAYEGEALRLVILPVSAVGYQSTIRANLAIEGDLNTVAGLSVVEQAETPGLGARIQEPAWQALWPGKKLADENGQIRLTVARGRATNEFEVDGITGATRTGNAVANAVHFWLGEHGYGRVLDRLKQEAGG